MIGYDLPENFRMPYLSLNIVEFWHRWHMTLSAWLRDYLYIPLGGNRHGTLLTYRNLLLTMLLGGLWHGASWNFVLWGGLHGTALAAHKLWTRFRERVGWQGRSWAGAKPLAWLVTLLFVMICWVPFRSHSFGDTLVLMKAMVGIGAGHYHWLPVWLFRCLGLCLLGHAIGWCIEKRLGAAQVQTAVIRKIELEPEVRATRFGRSDSGGSQVEPSERFSPMDKLLGWMGVEIQAHGLSGAWMVPARVTAIGAYAVTLLVLVTLFFAPLNSNPFIYFQF